MYSSTLQLCLCLGFKSLRGEANPWEKARQKRRGLLGSDGRSQRKGGGHGGGGLSGPYLLTSSGRAAAPGFAGPKSDVRNTKAWAIKPPP
ncbi:hypothetical protein NDU88_002546 [Pleurodeles waltl]|uniref:Uncharacterized protein n=1 Tax=Pleurodeles waltl TaxID=8319 RepID=A0AAV7QC22_PLEWA|nr:hypothetical protein NDU88_002546 [Pleurodeles waltl]